MRIGFSISKEYRLSVVPTDRWGSLVQKYADLARLAQTTSSEEKRARIRKIAEQWPGALREAERVGPFVCSSRAEVCAELRERSCLSRAKTIDCGEVHLSVLLMGDLHALIREALVVRPEARPFRGAPGQSAMKTLSRWSGLERSSIDALLYPAWPPLKAK